MECFLNAMFFPRRSSLLAVSYIILFIFVHSPLQGKSRFVTIQCSDTEVLKKFNNNLELGRNLASMIKRKDIITVEDEVYAKVDLIVEKVEVVLDMFPNDIQFNLVILPSRQKVAEHYKKTYGKTGDYIAYYSISQKTIYISAGDVNLRVLAHEIGHMVVDHFFQVRPPYNIHELMAQFAEKHVTD